MTAPADDALPTACTCPKPWVNLIAVIEGQTLAAQPAQTLGPPPPFTGPAARTAAPSTPATGGSYPANAAPSDQR